MNVASYDAEADVLYVNLQPGVAATESELTADDILIRYADREVIGITVMNARQRLGGELSLPERRPSPSKEETE